MIVPEMEQKKSEKKVPEIGLGRSGERLFGRSRPIPRAPVAERVNRFGRALKIRLVACEA